MTTTAYDPNSPMVLTAREARDAIFCFTGEFGYELISWIPYLLFLKQTLGLELRTISRTGSRVFYPFSAEHLELPPELIGDTWGHPLSYATIAQQLGGRPLVHPGPDVENKRLIRIGGYEWTTRNIHGSIAETNYLRPDYSSVRPRLPFAFDRPYVVLNNKYFLQWATLFSSPINFFSVPDLLAIKRFLHERGFAVVYNHFVERTATDTHCELHDRGIFGEDGGSFDMRSHYEKVSDVGARNEVQLGMYNGAAFVLGPQGGNVYLPAMCRKDVYMLMRCGDYKDYKELERLYGNKVEVFYETAHLLHWLDAELGRAAPLPSSVA